MNLRFAVLITGCMLAGAAAAAYHRVDSGAFARPSPAAALPLFMRAATSAPTTAAWPPSTSVAFFTEMFTKLPVATAPGARSEATPPVATLDDAPQRPPLRVATIGAGNEPASPSTGSEPTPPRNNSDTVEVVIRDRFGRPIRVERVDRRLLAGPRGYPAPPPRSYGSYPHAPYGAYGPYR